MLSHLVKAAAAPVAGVVLAGAGLFGLIGGGGDGYQVVVIFPDAANLVRGGQVQVDGIKAGSIESLAIRDGKALVRISVSGDHAPLHTGTLARIDYKSLLGERIVALRPGPAANPPIPNRGIIEGGAARIDFDQLLGAFDPATRQHLRQALPALDAVLNGREAKVGETLGALPSFTDAVTQLLVAAGKDGPALRQLVQSLSQLSTRLVERRADVAGVVDGLERFATANAGRDEALAAGLDALPGTLQAASGALNHLPGAAAATVPLLNDLRPVAEQLGPLSAELRPVLADLRPTLSALRPALTSLSGVLDVSPSMLGAASGFLPGADQSLRTFVPMLDFLRPYTPEMAGALANWASAASNFDRNGHYLRVQGASGTAGFDRQPALFSPTQRVEPRRAPGENEDQSWTDANAGATDANGTRMR